MLGVYLFYSLFYSFEDLQLLNLDDTRHIYTLHFFNPIIQEHLGLFQQGWAHHSLRTEHNTPQQLWIIGLQEEETDGEAASGLSVSLLPL